MNKEKCQQTIKDRQKYNTMIIQELSQYITDNPSIRFGQALHNLIFSKLGTLDYLALDHRIYNMEPSEMFTLLVKENK